MRRLGAGIAASAVVATSLVTIGVGVSPALADPFSCDVNTIYAQNAAGEIRAVDVSATPGLGGPHATGQRANGLGISADGNLSYTLDNSSGTGGMSKQIAIYDGVNDTTETKLLGDATVPDGIIRGAVSPSTGIYYYAGSGEDSYLGAYDPSTGQAIGQVGVLSTGVDGNGDFAFGANGELYVLADRDIFVVQAEDVPTTAGNSSIPLAAVTQLPAGTQGNGIAFGANGKLFVSQSNSISEVNLATGELLREIPTGTFSNTDLASCSFPNTLTVQKNVVDRYADGDQFTITAAGASGTLASATTAGAASGVQQRIAGPVFVEENEVYTVSETSAGGADLANYESSVSCQTSSGEPVETAGTAPAWSLTFPESLTGENVVCTITNNPVEPAVPGLDLRKTADPVNGSAVQVGDRVTYTVEAENTGNTLLDPVEITDDLSGVFDSADYQDDVTTAIDDIEITSGGATIDDDQLTWSGPLEPGQVVTITYSVIVNDGVEGETLENRVTASGVPPNGDPENPIVPPAVTTEHPVAGFEIAKTANPESGTTVQPGQIIEYTVTGTNTGASGLQPAAIADDLSEVFAYAEYNDDVDASIGIAEISGAELTWTGSLAPGASVEITYTVTVGDDASGAVLNNIASGIATPLTPNPEDPEGPGIPGEPIVPTPVETEHPAIGSGFEVSKTADPASGTAVDPGSVITYTVTGRNTGDTLLSPAAINDNLAQVLAHTEYNNDVDVNVGSAAVTGNDLSWTGSLAPGATVIITYSVTVNADAGGALVANTVSGSATPQIPEDPSDPESPTTPGDPLTPPNVTTEHPVNVPGFELTKSVDPISGTAVNAGDTLTYTLTGVNTGETALDPVTIDDDLSRVLDHASYNDDATALVNGAPAGAPEVIDTALIWNGDLAVGETVTITYSVTVGPDAAGENLINEVSAEATPPGGDELVPPPVTTDNPVNVPGFSVSKSANPESGTTVDPGSTITYTVTGINTGETVLDPVEIVDDLSGVLSEAAYNGDLAVDSGIAEIENQTLVWNGSLAVGETVTITYSVTISPDAGGSTLENTVRGTATPPGGTPPIETPPSVTEHPVNEPGFELVKVADPASGDAVDPGSTVTYTVMGINTGETALTDVRIIDDLSDVFAHANYNDDVHASTGFADITGSQLEWNGDLAIGERVTLTYSVTVHGDAGGQTISNLVTGTAVPPGGSELTPPPGTTEHPINKPGFEFSKTADPKSGTLVATGGDITYTLTGANIGQTVLHDVTISDDLSQVLNSATLRGDITATINGERAGTPEVEGARLMWSGSLQIGESVTITYTVKVNDDAAGKTLGNVATATATPPGGHPITPPAGETEHPVATPLAVTGERAMPWLAALAALLIVGGGTLVASRRRAAHS